MASSEGRGPRYRLMESDRDFCRIQRKDACIFLVWVSSKHSAFAVKPKRGVDGCLRAFSAR